MSSGLVDVLTLQAIQALADARTLARGMAYFHGGAVGLLEADEYEARASVQGTQRYHVRLTAGSGSAELDYACDCPVGEDGTFCKHAVAVALSWLENTGEEVFAPGAKESVKPRKKRKTHAEQILEYLDTLSESALREWLMEAADRDAGIRDKLLFSARARAGSDIAALKSVVRQATKVSAFVDWPGVGDYANRLGKGEPGLARYRQLMEGAWKKLPALGPEAFRTHFDSDRYRIEHAMEELIALSGDIDGLVTVKSRNLSSPHAFLKVAELLQRHGRRDDAIKWAEKGMAAFPGERLDDLVKFCIAEHLRRGDAGRVESLAWQRFQRQPGSEAYFELVGVAKRIGRADDLAAKALAHLWQLVRAEEAPGAKRLPSWQPPLRSALVTIHLRESDAERMWETFCAGTVDVRLWDKVAARRGKTHPDEAVTLYKKLLPHAVNAGTRGAQYGEAFEIVKAMQELRVARGEEVVFKQELTELRLTWKAKRNFMKLLATFD